MMDRDQRESFSLNLWVFEEKAKEKWEEKEFLS